MAKKMGDALKDTARVQEIEKVRTEKKVRAQREALEIVKRERREQQELERLQKKAKVTAAAKILLSERDEKERWKKEAALRKRLAFEKTLSL